MKLPYTIIAVLSLVAAAARCDASTGVMTLGRDFAGVSWILENAASMAGQNPSGAVSAVQTGDLKVATGRFSVDLPILAAADLENRSLGYRLGYFFGAVIRIIIVASPVMVIAIVIILIKRRKRGRTRPPDLPR